MYVHAQLTSQREGGEEVETSKFRDALDDALWAPMGDEAEDLDAITRFLRGG